MDLLLLLLLCYNAALSDWRHVTRSYCVSTFYSAAVHRQTVRRASLPMDLVTLRPPEATRPTVSWLICLSAPNNWGSDTPSRLLQGNPGPRHNRPAFGALLSNRLRGNGLETIGQRDLG